MPSKKGKRPWWYSPTVWEIYTPPDVARRSNLHSLILTRIQSAIAEKPFPYNRPKRTGHNWLEDVVVDGVLYRLSCCVDDYQNKEFIVLRNIKKHKKMR